MKDTLPRNEVFMLPTLKVLVDMGGSGSNEDIDAAVIAAMAISQDQVDITYPNRNTSIVIDRIRWARSYLKFPEFVDNPSRGVWIITPAGRAAVNLPEPELRAAVSKGYALKHPPKVKDAASSTAQERTVPDAEDWSDRLLTTLQALEPSAFERLCRRMLLEHGFTHVEVTGKSGDGGIDGQGVLRVNLVSFHVLFQCKRYKGSVGASTIRDFRGAMQGRADKGLVITTGTFTPDARREATRDGAPAIDLIDGDALCELLRDKGLGVTVTPVTTYEISVDAAFFEGI